MEEATRCLSEHWFDLLQTIGIVASFSLAAYTTRRDERARKITNAIAIEDQHRSIWKEVYGHPELGRTLSRDADAKNISTAEEVFVTSLISHLATVFRAMIHDEFVTVEGLQRDVREFFFLPIPRKVWGRVKDYQNKDFAEFVESCLKANVSD
jgi:hypothetical protein